MTREVYGLAPRLRNENLLPGSRHSQRVRSAFAPFSSDYAGQPKAGKNAQPGPIQNEVADVTSGNVTPEDYDAWRARFGNTSGSGSGQVAAVPEPSTLALLNLAAPMLERRQRS
jgi:hypothetical protein